LIDAIFFSKPSSINILITVLNHHAV